MKFLIVDDHDLYIEGVKLLLKNMSFKNIQIVTSPNVTNALKLVKQDSYDIIITDLDMPTLSGLDFITALKHLTNIKKIVVLSGINDVSTMRKIYDMGVDGYIDKSEHSMAITKKLQSIINGDRCFPDVFWQKFTQTELLQTTGQITGSDIKGRQLEILKLLDQGKPTKKIALILDITESTVNFHIKSLYRKLNVNKRTECVYVARGLNII